MTFRVIGLLVLLYVTTDLSAASIPGIFSFAADQLFVDGVVRIEAAGQIAEPADRAPEPSLRARPVDAPAVAKLVAGPARSSLASSRHRPRHGVAMTAGRDRADGEPPA
jgi:hypothetical protein